MPPLMTNCDSLREYLSGATSDGGSQINLIASLGGYRSSTEALSYGIYLENALYSVSIDFASGGCAAGPGILQCIDANNIAWNDNGGQQGVPLNLPSSGSTGIVEAVNRNAYLRVTRRSVAPIAVPNQKCIVTLSPIYNDVFAFDNVTTQAGVIEYQATILKNVHVSGHEIFKIYRWIPILGVFSIALDPAGVQPAGSTIQTIANINTAPTGVTWNQGTTKATGLFIPVLSYGQQIGIWIRRQIPALVTATPRAMSQFQTQFDAY